MEVTRWIGWVVCALVVTGCTTPQPSTADREDAPPIRSASPEVQAEFDAALEDLEAGRYTEAEEAFRVLQSSHQGDEVATLAELYIGRAQLGDLEALFEESRELSGDAEGLLGGLVSSRWVDDRIRFGAAVYLAVGRAGAGNVERALATLGEYPGPSLSPVVLEKDRQWVWPLVAEGLMENGRPADAVRAWAKYYDELVATAEAEEELPDALETTAEEVPAQERFAVARAFTAGDDLSLDQARQLMTEEFSLSRAVGGWSLLRHLVGEPQDDESREVLQELFNEVAPDLLAVDATSRAAELSTALASVAGPERILIGALLPLTGSDRSVGRRALAGMLVAQRSFHVAGDPRITLVIEDSHGDAAGGYERLVELGVLAVVGPLQPGQARELIEPARQRGVPVIAMTAEAVRGADEEEAEVPSPVYRNFLNAVAEAQAAATLAFHALEDRRAAVVFPDMGYGQTMAYAFAEEFRRQGGEVVAEVPYDRSSSDFSDVARQVARSRPDVIFLPDTGSKVAEVTAFFAQENIWGLAPDRRPPSRSQRIHVHYLGTSLWQDPMLLHQASSYVNGALIPAWYSPVFGESETRQFAGIYEAIYDRRADHFEIFAHDTILHLRSLLLERGVSGSGLVEALEAEEWTHGAAGRFRYRADGEPQRYLRFLRVQGGEWAVYDHRVRTPLDVDEAGALEGP